MQKKRNEKNMKIKIGSKNIVVEVKKLSSLGMARGLMFRRREKASALLFEFSKPVSFHLTSLFVFFPFLVLWLDKKNKVIAKKRVNPWVSSISSPIKSYYKILEIPINKKYRREIKLLDES